jgi:CubicO group peptidase (beta-lactamase class C family)
VPPWSAAARQEVADPVASPVPAQPMTDALVGDLDADVAEAIETFGIVGAAMALVQGNKIVMARGYGVTDLQRNRPVTERTRFRIGSNTKSMTAFLLATCVDQGLLAWDDRVVDCWPAFQGPTPELTANLTLRNLMGMATGIAESETIEFFLSTGDESPLDLLRSTAYLSVIAPPETTFAYNNTLVCDAAYVALLAEGTTLDQLDPAYAGLLHERLFAPLGMRDSSVASDPRPTGEDYAIGYSQDLYGRRSEVPFISIGGAAPAGAGLASVQDMARYLIMQMQGGITQEGKRVVSAANLAETHRPGIAIPLGNPEATPDTIAMHYALGWFIQTFRDGRQSLWHSGGIDGFSSQMGFFPVDQLGYVVLSNQEPGRNGGLFTTAIEAILLSRLYGLNTALPELVASLAPGLAEASAALAARTRPVDPTTVQPWLGLYDQGFSLRLDDAGALHLDHDIRSMPLVGMNDGSYLVVDGPGVIVEHGITFSTDAEGERIMRIAGFDPVRWLTGA